MRGASPSSETMSESAIERNTAERALISKPPKTSQVLANKSKSGCAKSYSDNNGNDVKVPHKGRKTFAFWVLVCLLFVLAVGNLALTFTILAVLRLGHGMESIEFLPDHNAVKLRGKIDLEHVHKRDGIIESFRDESLQVSSDNGSVVVHLQTRAARTDTKLTVNTSGIFFSGVNTFRVQEPSGAGVFSAPHTEIVLNEPLNNLHAKQITTKLIRSPLHENLTLRSESSAYLRGAEGSHIESKQITFTADQDIYIKSINGSVILSGKDGVFVDVRYLPIALPVNHTGYPIGQFKICVCMPQGKLFRIAVPTGQKISCSHVNMNGDLNPCL